jgi:DNA replication and repair protein RecF
LLPELDTATLRWRRGWDETQSLRDALAGGRERDRELGYTVSGPHRGDLKLQLSSGLGRFELSRGQQKLVALGMLLATAAALRETVGWAPLLLLDDLPSELDLAKQAACLEHASSLGSQIWVTGTIAPAGLAQLAGERRCFRVEAGRVEGVDW